MEVVIANAKFGLKHDVVRGIFAVDRRSPVGNKFIMYSEDQRDKVCDQYEEWFYAEALSDHKIVSYLERIRRYLIEHGKVTLLCWCAPQRCHAETIRKWLESSDSISR